MHYLTKRGTLVERCFQNIFGGLSRRWKVSMNESFERNHHHDHGSHCQSEHGCHSIVQELICHAPYAIFAVTLALAVALFWSSSSTGAALGAAACSGASRLFHGFHFIHIVFSSTGVLVTYFRFSKNRNVLRGFIVGGITAASVCILSDAVLPYLGGRILGAPIQFHFCWLHELHNVFPFLIIGLCNGWILSTHHSNRQTSYSALSHTAHIIASSFASLFYMISYGFVMWYANLGMVFLVLLVAVVVPCTMSDLVIPMLVARADGKK